MNEFSIALRAATSCTGLVCLGILLGLGPVLKTTLAVTGLGDVDLNFDTTIDRMFFASKLRYSASCSTRYMKSAFSFR